MFVIADDVAVDDVVTICSCSLLVFNTDDIADVTM